MLILLAQVALLGLTMTVVTHAQSSGRVYELRTYTCNEGKLPDLLKRFREHTMTIFERHHMHNVGYWIPADEPRHSNTLIYIIWHDSRLTATQEGRRRLDALLPYLLICAFIANAASFLLPISNPANLVIYGSHMPPLLQWLPAYAFPSVVSIATTYLLLRWTQRGALNQKIATDVPVPVLSGAGKTAAIGIAATAIVLLVASALDVALGLPTAIAGTATAALVLIRERKGPWIVVKDISWGVLPLVAGLFVLVEALDKTGLIRMITAFLHDEAQRSVIWAAWGAGIGVAVASNLINNLPTGLIAGAAVQNAHVPDQITRAILIGVDLGPNLSVTGSLATILWLTALRREDQTVSAGAFLKLGIVVMPPALLLAIGAALLVK